MPPPILPPLLPRPTLPLKTAIEGLPQECEGSRAPGWTAEYRNFLTVMGSKWRKEGMARAACIAWLCLPFLQCG